MELNLDFLNSPAFSHLREIYRFFHVDEIGHNLNHLPVNIMFYIMGPFKNYVDCILTISPCLWSILLNETYFDKR